MSQTSSSYGESYHDRLKRKTFTGKCATCGSRDLKFVKSYEKEDSYPHPSLGKLHVYEYECSPGKHITVVLGYPELEGESHA